MELIEFWTICSSNGIVLDREQMKQIERFRDELKYWNEKINLISRKEEEEILEKHILHSLSILKYLKLKSKAKCLDLGSGGGFPGIPLKIAQPDIYMLLVDSIAKKVKMSDMFAKHTGLKNIKSICVRAEDLINDKQYKKSFDYIFVRAVAQIDKILLWIKEILNPSGQIVFLKGGDIVEEINNAKKSFPSLIVNEISIDIKGVERYKLDEKKIVICSNIN